MHPNPVLSHVLGIKPKTAAKRQTDIASFFIRAQGQSFLVI